MSEEIVLERLGRILSGVSVMPARVDEYDAAHPPPEVCVCLPEFFCIGSFLSYTDFVSFMQDYGRAFKLVVPTAAADDVAEEEAEEDEDDVVAAAGNVVETVVSGPGSSSARLSIGLFEGQHSYVKYVPDPRTAQYILLSRKERTGAASKHLLPKRRRSARQHPPIGNILVGELVLSLSRVVFPALS